MTLRTDVVALYVEPRGPYPGLVAEWYDEARDARTYAGPLPVVAHPPCGPWGRLRHMCRHPEQRPLALEAVEQVRRFGGVLEHPRGSLLWSNVGADLPLPGDPPDAFGGWSVCVSQCDWGHPARKQTWLYIVGTSELGAFPPPREPTHWISGGRGREGKKRKTTPVPPGIKVCSAQQRRRTPPAFAAWLLELASLADSGRRSPQGLIRSDSERYSHPAQVASPAESFSFFDDVAAKSSRNLAAPVGGSGGHSGDGGRS